MLTHFHITKVSALHGNDSKDGFQYWSKYALYHGQIPLHSMTHPLSFSLIFSLHMQVCPQQWKPSQKSRCNMTKNKKKIAQIETKMIELLYLLTKDLGHFLYQSALRAVQNCVREHSVASVPAFDVSLYSLVIGVPDPYLWKPSSIHSL